MGANCVGVSEYESTGGRQTDTQTDSGGILEDFTRGQLLCFKNRETYEDSEVFIWDSEHDST